MGINFIAFERQDYSKPRNLYSIYEYCSTCQSRIKYIITGENGIFSRTNNAYCTAQTDRQSMVIIFNHVRDYLISHLIIYYSIIYKMSIYLRSIGIACNDCTTYSGSVVDEVTVDGGIL